MKILGFVAAGALLLGAGAPAMACGKSCGHGSHGARVFVMQGYSGKPQRSPNGQGTSAVLIKKGPNVSLWGPGNSPHKAIHAKKGYIP
jgi:hypothetical protein